MKLVLKGGCWHGMKQLFSLVILLGLLLVLLSLLMPLANDYRDVVANKISSLIQHPLKIGYLDLRWDGPKLKPVLTLRDVEIGDPETGEPMLRFAQMSIRISPWKTLVQHRLMPDLVTLSGSRIKIVRTPQERLHIEGVPQRRTHLSLINILDRVQGLTVKLNGIRAVWDDQLIGHQYFFQVPRLDLYTDREALALEAEIVPPLSLGEHVEFKLLAAGPLNDPRQWKSHYFVSGASINLAGLPYIRSGVLAQTDTATLDLKLWGSSSPETGFEVQGNVALNDVRVNAASAEDKAKFRFIDELSAAVQLTGDFHSWRLDLDQLRVMTPQKHWPESGLSIAWDDEADTYFGVIDYIDISTVGTLAVLMPGVPQKQLALLQALQPEGELRNISFTLPRTIAEQDKFAIEGRFDDIGWHQHERIPGVSPLSGEVVAIGNKGVARVDSSDLVFDYPHLFSNFIEAQALHAELDWEKTADAWSIAIENIILGNADGVVRGGGRVVLAAGEEYPQLGLELIAPSFPLGKVSHYIPYRIIPPKTAQWLHQAFKQGSARNIRFSYSGALKKKAFRDGVAKMEATAEFDGASLQYHPQWPVLTDLAGNVAFHNSRLDAAIKQGEVKGAQIEQATVSIADMFKARLDVKGKAHGTLPQALDFVDDSPLGRNLDDFLDDVTSSGRADVTLDMMLTLSKKLPKKERVQGTVALSKCEAALPKADVRIHDLRGQIAFDDTRFSSSDLRAVFRGAPVTGSVQTLPDERVQVLMDGIWNPADLLPSQRELIEPISSGRAAWHGVLNLPHREKGKPRQDVWLDVSSDLQGVAVDLPAPLGKSAAQKRLLEVSYRFSKPPRLHLSSPDLFDIVAEMQTQPRLHVVRAAVGLGQPAVRLPSQGIAVRGQWPEVDLAAWAAVVARYPTRQEKEETLLGKINRINTKVGRFLIAGQMFSDLQITAEKSVGLWRVNLDADSVAGNLIIPLPLKRAPLRASLDRLVLMRNDRGLAQSQKGHAFDPRSLPPIEAQSATLKWGDLSFSNMQLRSRPRTDGLEIERFALSTDHLEVTSHGYWYFGGTERSKFIFEADGSDVGKVLRAFDLGDSLGRGHGNMSGTVAWPGSPGEYSPVAATADLEVDLRDGWLKKVEPGLGRLIGLLSLDYLPRRLALNFKDMEDKGFYYEKLAGNGHLKKGVLNVDLLGIYGPVAQFLLTGKTDVVHRKYDLLLTVVPEISSSAPLAAGLIAGPQAGVAVFVLNKLVKEMGIDVNKSVALDYRVTGSWDEPVIETVGQEHKERNSTFEWLDE